MRVTERALQLFANSRYSFILPAGILSKSALLTPFISRHLRKEPMKQSPAPVVSVTSAFLPGAHKQRQRVFERILTRYEFQFLIRDLEDIRFGNEFRYYLFERIGIVPEHKS